MEEQENKCLIKQIEPRDLIAIIVIIGCVVLLMTGRDGFIAALLAAVVAYYFGYRKPFIVKNK